MRKTLVLELGTCDGVLRQKMDVPYPVKRTFRHVPGFGVTGLPGARKQHWAGDVEGKGWLHVFGPSVAPGHRDADGLYSYYSAGEIMSFTPLNELDYTILDFITIE